MSARLIEPTEAIEVRQLCVLAYGQPGSRKTSLAQTAEAPITLAFDPGVYRAFGRKKAALFDTWADVLAFDLEGYKTVVVDTVGMALDKLAASIVDENPKNGTRGGGLTLPGYGILKQRFAAWVGQLRQRGQHAVFIAHEKAERLGDEVYYCPDVTGGSYGTLMNHCDLVGYMHFHNGKRVIDFSPTDRWMAKAPPCGWETIVLPDFSKEPEFLGKLIGEAMASMGRVSEASAAAAVAVAHWKEWLGREPDLAAFNSGLADLAQLANGVKSQCWHLCLGYAERRGWEIPKGKKEFREKKAKEAKEAAATA